ncbi:hypothetical protein PV05_11737 [Exophiala xenobiotica]|uniref:Extracellular membrane protein CFEM domain-containing protein n=1 Tax=Exophiala xenobiotica TaxID=348802 RepID=A0A0D2EQT7_9EURO|nr:uncharacterized protein PV05_11737 [Exophiala xenobiotica]KIW50119.1 hypothetical protein PV05_11737 [Exophiala xenobiotica]
MFDCRRFLVFLICSFSLVWQTSSSSPDDIHSLPACAQSTCANYILTCYEGGQGTFEECVNSTQTQVYYCVGQLCPCEDVGAVEAWVYAYGTNELITTLWPWPPSMTSCVSTSKITLIGSPLSTGIVQSNSSSVSPEPSIPPPQRTTATTISQSQSPSIQTTSVSMTASRTPISETTSSISSTSSSSTTTTTSTTSPPSSTAPPSGSGSGISANAKIGIGVGAGLGGAGLLTLATAFSIWQYKRKDMPTKGGPHPGQQQPSPMQNGFDQAELSVNEALHHTSPAFSELEGSPVHRHFMQSDPNATTTHRDHRERSELQSTSTVSELDSSRQPRGDG